jgi:hypothetical protein
LEEFYSTNIRTPKKERQIKNEMYGWCGRFEGVVNCKTKAKNGMSG